MRNAVPAYAIVRVDEYVSIDSWGEQGPDYLTVKKVVWSQEAAEREVVRLNALNADKDCRYFWQYTRVEKPVP